MKKKVKDTPLLILQASKEEFLRKGFKNALLRAIAKKAGVTTGAIYSYYADKNSLFEALVSVPATRLLGEFASLQKTLASCYPEKQIRIMHKISEQGIEWMLDYIYDHFNAFKLIICCSTGTRYENYIDQMVEIEIKATHDFIEALKLAGVTFQPIDNQLMHILAKALFEGIFEIVRHDMDKKRAKAYIASLIEFREAGWDRLLGL